jgi:hypothetical protein
MKELKRLPNSLQLCIPLLLPLMLRPLNKLPSALQPLPLPPKQGKLKKPLLLLMLKKWQLVLAGSNTSPITWANSSQASHHASKRTFCSKKANQCDISSRYHHHKQH